MRCIFRTNRNGVLTQCIFTITNCNRSRTRSICIYTHCRRASTSSTGVVTNYCRVLTSLFRCCLPFTLCVINIVIGTNSNSASSICITYITYSQRSITGSVITRPNSCSSATCSRISITYCSSRIICRCIFSANRYLTVMASYIISSILVTYNDRVLTNIIVFTIKARSSISPNVNMAITSIITCLCF